MFILTVSVIMDGFYTTDGDYLKGVTIKWSE